MDRNWATTFQWTASPRNNIRALSPRLVPQILPPKGSAVVVTATREDSTSGPGIRGRRTSLPNSVAAATSKAASLSDAKISAIGVTRLQEAAMARPMASQLRLKSPEALALDRNRRAATTGAPSNRVQGQALSVMANTRKREALPANSPRVVINGGGITRTVYRRPSGRPTQTEPNISPRPKVFAGQEGTKRSSADVTDVAQMDTHSPLLVATVLDEQAEAPTNSSAGGTGLSSAVPLQLEQPVADTTVTVVVVEDFRDAPEDQRTLPQQQDVLSPIPACAVGDTGGAPSPSHAVQLVPQELMQQEQQLQLQKASRPTATSCCFGFLHRKPTSPQ